MFSCLILASALVALNAAVLFITAARLSSVAVRSGTLAPLDVSRQRLLSAFCPVDAVLAVRVLGVIKFVLFHRRVGDELGSNLLELCTTLLVDTSGASSLMLIKSVARALMTIFSAVSSCAKVFLSISTKAQMLVMTESSPCLGGRWELYGPRDSSSSGLLSGEQQPTHLAYHATDVVRKAS